MHLFSFTGIGFGGFPGLRILAHGFQVPLRATQQAQAPVEKIDFDQLRAKYLRKPAGGGMGLDFHLPEAVPCGDIALGEVQVMGVFGEDMGNPSPVIGDMHGVMQAGQPQFFAMQGARSTAEPFGIGPETGEGVKEFSRWGKRAQAEAAGETSEQEAVAASAEVAAPVRFSSLFRSA